jgi:hypothetical protein
MSEVLVDGLEYSRHELYTEVKVSDEDGGGGGECEY